MWEHLLDAVLESLSFLSAFQIFALQSWQRHHDDHSPNDSIRCYALLGINCNFCWLPVTLADIFVSPVGAANWSKTAVLRHPIILHSVAMTNSTQTCNAGFRLACRLPLCSYAAWSSLAVSELQLSAATPLWLYHRAASLPSWIKFNCLRSAAVGKAARLSIYWLDAACRLVIPLRQVALVQLNKYHHQSGNAASGKLVWNQHKAAKTKAVFPFNFHCCLEAA